MASGLYERIAGYETVAVTGMSKNAGKTTVLGHLIREAAASGKRLGLTSIGRDGEPLDLVTGTKKPGIYIPEGSLFATAAGLLPLCDVTREITLATGVDTPLGEVVLARALSDGFVQLAGPSIVEQLVALCGDFRRENTGQILIDGALGRKSFCSRRLADAVVLCTGASLAPSPEAVAAQTAFQCEILSLPEYQGAVPENLEDHRFWMVGEQCEPLPDDVPLADAARRLLEGGRAAALCPGALTDRLVDGLIRAGGSFAGLALAARDSSKVLLSQEAHERLRRKGVELQVLEKTYLAAVAVNPFSAYGTGFDRAVFHRLLAEKIDVPVYDVGEDGYDCIAL